jgi:hypothetical protein
VVHVITVGVMGGCSSQQHLHGGLRARELAALGGRE